MKKRNLFNSLFVLLIVLFLTSAGLTQDKVTKNFQVKKGDNLTLKVVGDINIESWNKDEVNIEVVGLIKDDLGELKITQDGNTVSVILKNADNASFSIKIPEQFNMDVKTSGGDLSFLGKFIGNVKGKTAGGDIKIETIKGIVELVTAGGDIKTGDINGDLKATTAGGDINVGIISGEGKLATSGGDISVQASSKTLSVNTSGGNIKIGNITGDISAATSGGDIEVGIVTGMAKLNTSGGDIKLSGAKGSISVNTSGGDLKLEKLTGSLKAHTSGGRVYAELTPDGSGESELASSGGKVTFLIPENSKATIEATIKINSWNKNKDKYKIYSEFKQDSYKVDEDEKEIKAIYTLNGGGKLITLTTSNSDIEIKKLSK